MYVSIYLSICFNTIRTFADIEYMSSLTMPTINRHPMVTSRVLSLRNTTLVTYNWVIVAEFSQAHSLLVLPLPYFSPIMILMRSKCQKSELLLCNLAHCYRNNGILCLANIPDNALSLLSLCLDTRLTDRSTEMPTERHKHALLSIYTHLRVFGKC